MRTRLLPTLFLFSLPLAAQAADRDLARWRSEAARVTITRDDWGIAHVRGKTDADAVFGMIYAQAEDDFNRVEVNYLTALGWTAQAEGEKAIWADLRARLYMDPEDLKARYAASPAWLRRLMDSWADGLNYYLATHRNVRPRVIKRFEPWMALSFTEGSIGGDIERIDLAALETLYSKNGKALAAAQPAREREPSGSNGFAVAPSNTVNGKALLYINPHTSFYFRSEQQVTSGEGLNAYGAATWGQFFIYQGFNGSAGWMHTSSNVDVVDEFLETIEQKPQGLFYRYGNALRPVVTKTVTVPYRAADGTMASRVFETYRTHHGPIVREAGEKWVAFAMMHKPVEALQQSFLRTKAMDFASFVKVAELKANSSNNTVFASAKGEIAYLHPQFIPVRDVRFDYTKPVDGSDPRTEWRGLHALSEAPRVLNPRVGWIQNTNNWPYSAAGPDSPKREDYPRYMDTLGENPRGLNAVRLLSGRKDFTMESLRAAGYDNYLIAFPTLLPGLFAAYDALAPSDPLKPRLAEPIERLRSWDHRSGIASVPTTLALYWGDQLWDSIEDRPAAAGMSRWDYMEKRVGGREKLEALAVAMAELERRFGRWRIAWGETNRLQRVSGDISQKFSDDAPSLPVGFASGNWGSLPVFGGNQPEGTKRFYGTRGNSFVAVVEFGERVKARALSTGGASGNPRSKHFFDQAGRYAAGDLREVYFYPEQLRGHTERIYHPGR